MSKSDEMVGKQRRNEAKKPRVVTEKKRAASAKNIRDYREKLGPVATRKARDRLGNPLKREGNASHSGGRRNSRDS
jgi:hypothetical protein